MTTDKEAEEPDVGYEGDQTLKREREKRRIEERREQAQKTVNDWLDENKPTAPIERALMILDMSPFLEPTDWDKLSKEEQTERRKQQRELTQARNKAKITVGTWIYLKEPAEPVYKALGILGMPRYPDGRVDKYDPNESFAATGSAGS